MKGTLIPALELGEDLVNTWIELQQANPDLASPYFHPAFTKAIATVRHDVEVAVLQSEGKTVAFFPFQREQGDIGRPVGGIISDYHGLICAPDFQFSPSELLEQSRLNAWEFDHLPISQVSFAPFQWSIESSPQIDLSSGYDAYVQQRRIAGSKQIKKVHGLMKRLEREIGPLRFVPASTDENALSTVFNWKSGQYRETGKCDLFATGWVRQALEGIFATQEHGCSGILSLLYAGDRLVAGHFGMRSRPIWHYWFPSYDPDAAKHSPGLILLLKMAEHAPEVGVRVIDLGKGLSPYKERLMNSRSQLGSGRLELPSWRSLARKTWRILRSRLNTSPLGPVTRAGINWLRRRGMEVPG